MKPSLNCSFSTLAYNELLVSLERYKVSEVTTAQELIEPDVFDRYILPSLCIQ